MTAIVLDFEEEKKKLFGPKEPKSDVKAAATEFLFSRKPLRDRVFMTLRALIGESTDDVVVSVLTDKLLPYAEGNFLKPVANGSTEAAS